MRTLGKAVRRLELDLDVKLLERLPRDVSPTLFREALAAHAHLIGDELDRAKSAIDDLRDGTVGQVVVGAGSSMRIDLLPRASKALRDRAPGAKIKVVASLSDDLISDLKRGSLDVVLSMIPEPTADAALVHEPLYHDQNYPCVRPGHPLMALSAIRPEDLLGYDWILPATSNLSRQHLDAVFQAKGLRPPRVAIECNSAVFATRMNERSDLIGLLPTQVIVDDRRDAIVALPAPEVTLSRMVGISYRRASVLSPVTRLMIAEPHCASAEMVEEGKVTALGVDGAEPKPDVI